MQKLQDSVFSIVKTTNLSPAVFSFLQPSEDQTDKTPLGGILNDTKHGWLALGPKFCVVDLRTGLKIAARTFGTPYGNSRTTVTSVVELPIPLTDHSKQLIISLCEDITCSICVFHINGSQVLRCIQSELMVTELAVCDGIPNGPFTCFDGIVMAGTKSGEVFVFDLNRAGLIQAIKDISQGNEHLIQNEGNPANLTFLPLNALSHIEEQRDFALENNDHLAILLNENSLVDGQYLFRNPDGSIRMKAKRDHIRITVLQYIPQLGSLAVGYNFGAFQIWNLLTLDLEFTSQVNVECLPVTHFGFQEPCDDPKAFCYLWVVFSAIDRFEEEEFPLAVMYSLTYQGKRMLSDTKCLYQDFSMATIRFQVELSAMEDANHLVGGKCVSCHTYSVSSTLGSEGEDSMLNICQLVWECWGENANSSCQYGMLLFDLDQWYKDQMPATYRLESNAFMSATCCRELGQGGSVVLGARLDPASVCPYSHATRLEEHFYPNSLQYNCICLNTSEAIVLSTIGIQRQIISSMDDIGPTALLNPPRLYAACVSAGLTPLYADAYARDPSLDEQRRFLLSVALEARLSRFLKRCAHVWATGTHASVGCTLPFLVDWCWQRAIELKENAKELTAPLFSSSALPDRNVVRCLEHSVQQLTQLTGLLDAVLTKCCNLVVPDALSEMEEKYKGIGTVSLYFQVVQWCLRVGLLPERGDGYHALPYPAQHLYSTYNKRRLKLQRLEDNTPVEEKANKSCSLLYIDQLIEHEFGGERVRDMWVRGGSECHGLYPPPSLYSLLRLYLLPDVAEQHKHSLLLYLLVDYSVVYDQVRYEAVIRRLMQFPTMFGLSNTAIKATQAFWHLDHRDFDFALDQLQCLTGNTLSEWQHSVVLSSLLAQKKTQAALQYLHVRKPAPVQIKDGDGLNTSRASEQDKLDDWRSCCSLYLARGLVFGALDVVRTCVQSAAAGEDKVRVLHWFYRGCRNTGQLCKLLQVTLLPLEEEVFIKYLQNCNESQTSDILVMYYLQQARYLEAEQYNNKLRQNKSRSKDPTGSIESLADTIDRESARDTIVEVACGSVPAIAAAARDSALAARDLPDHAIAPKPLSVFVQAKSPKNTFTYKSSFIQNTIENASETWMNRPKMRKGLKRALEIEETPFICTPKLSRSRSIFADLPTDATPPKRPKFDPNTTPKTPKFGSAVKLDANLSQQLAALLDMPEVQSPECKLYAERSHAGTPHSILKIRRNELDRDAPSPVDSRYLGDSEDDMLETSSIHTHYSDSTNKHLRFTIPTASESGSTPSPPAHVADVTERESREHAEIERDDNTTTHSHAMDETHPMESPPKKLATEQKVTARKSYKDTVKARRSLSISANSSLSDDPNTSIESIADIPVTLINPRYSARQMRQTNERERDSTMGEIQVQKEDKDGDKVEMPGPRTPKGRRAIRCVSGESTPVVSRSRSVTPDRADSPVTPLPQTRAARSRSRSRTPEVSPRGSPLAPIPELPALERDTARTTLSVPMPVPVPVPGRLRSRSRTPERVDKGVADSPRLEVIEESPTKSTNTESSSSSPSRRSLRSRSRTPEVEIAPEQTRQASPRTLRSRAKTPEKIMSPKVENSARGKKSLSRIVLEANAFAKCKQNLEKNETEQSEEAEKAIECTPMKAVKAVPSLMDVTLSPIVNKSVLQSSSDSVLETTDKDSTKAVDKSGTELGLKPLPAFTTLHETYFEKSVLKSYRSSIADTTESTPEKETKDKTNVDIKSLPAFTTINETGIKSVLHSYESSVAETSQSVHEEVKVTEVTKQTFTEMVETNFEKSVLRSYQSSVAESSQEQSKDSKALKDMSLITNDSDVEMKEEFEWKAKVDNQAAVIQKEKEKIVDIEREINELEGDMTDDDGHAENSGSSDAEVVEEESDESQDEDTSEEAESSAHEEVISINDTTESDDSTSSDNKLQIDEEISSDANKPSEDEAIANIEEAKMERIIQVTVEQDARPERASGSQETNQVIDPLNQQSMLTDDNSVGESEHSDVNLNYSDEKKSAEEAVDSNKDTPMETESAVQVLIVEEIKTTGDTKSTQDVPQSIGIVDPFIPTVKFAVVEIKPEDSKPAEKPSVIEKEITKQTDTTEEKDRQNKPSEKVEESQSNKESKSKETEIDQQQRETKDNAEDQVAEEKDKESDRPATRTRKRAKSTSSNKSVTESKADDVEEPKTPATRKRTQSTASNAEQKTPESTEVSTPTRRRAKTPTSAEVRKIMTRRASREMSEKMDESKELEELATPTRRSTRSRAKNDDNESVASESSVRSTRSRASEDAGDVKPAQVRKGRKSVVATKPDLSVIPETIAEEESKATEDIISDYSSSRRLTRHQKAVLESCMEAGPSPGRGRRASRSRDEEDAGSPRPAFDVQPLDRISLLNKQDFEGSPDADELRSASPDSFTSETSKQRRARLGRAASEARSTPKAAKKITRRVSVDVALVRTPEAGSPVPTAGSPAGSGAGRGRRASFNRACEALHTPKGRRNSTDVRKEASSPVESAGTPEPGEGVAGSGEGEGVAGEGSSTPARRSRRTASTHSNTSQAKADTSKRSKKTLDESKDTKMK